MKRFICAVAVAVIVVGAAAPAWAHEEIDPPAFTTGKPTFFTLSAANEEKVDLVKISVVAPAGVPVGGTTKEPTGWTVGGLDEKGVTWTAAAGAGVKPDHFEQWGFETDGADQPGTFTFKLTLTFADGKTEDVDVPVKVTAPVTPTAAPAKAKASNGRANAALIVGIAGVVLALGAIALGRRPPAPPAGDASKTW